MLQMRIQAAAATVAHWPGFALSSDGTSIWVQCKGRAYHVSQLDHIVRIAEGKDYRWWCRVQRVRWASASDRGLSLVVPDIVPDIASRLGAVAHSLTMLASINFQLGTAYPSLACALRSAGGLLGEGDLKEAWSAVRDANLAKHFGLGSLRGTVPMEVDDGAAAGSATASAAVGPVADSAAAACGPADSGAESSPSTPPAAPPRCPSTPPRLPRRSSRVSFVEPAGSSKAVPEGTLERPPLDGAPARTPVRTCECPSGCHASEWNSGALIAELNEVAGGVLLEVAPVPCAAVCPAGHPFCKARRWPPRRVRCDDCQVEIYETVLLHCGTCGHDRGICCAARAVGLSASRVPSWFRGKLDRYLEFVVDKSLKRCP